MVFLSVALKRLSLKRCFQRGRRLMFKTNFEIAKVGTSCRPEMNLGLNPKIGSDGEHCQLSNAPLDAFGIRLPAKLYSSRQKSFSGGRACTTIALELLRWTPKSPNLGQNCPRCGRYGPCGSWKVKLGLTLSILCRFCACTPPLPGLELIGF